MVISHVITVRQKVGVYHNKVKYIRSIGKLHFKERNVLLDLLVLFVII